MKNFPLLIGTIIFTLILIFGTVAIFSKNGQQDTGPVSDDLLVSQGNQHTLGNPEAEIVIVEFSDFQCPACKSTEPLVKTVVDQYSADVKLIYRHFPLSSIHTNAQLAAQASEVAADYGQFWQMHDLLFENQSVWSSMSVEEAKEQFAQYASQLQIDKSEFSSKIESDEIKQRVYDDLADANKLNLPGTPSIFVNGIKTSAPQLEKTVESLLTN